MLKDLGQHYTRIGVFKFWNVCCEACLARTPALCIDASPLTYDEVVHAHGLSMQGSLSMLNSLLEQSETDAEEVAAKAKFVLSQIQASVRRDRGASHVHNFEEKLSQLYNTLVYLDNGTVIHIKVADGRAFRVALQGMVFADSAHKRSHVTRSYP